MISKPFTCSFCNNGFSRERTLLNHLCEKKRRYFNRTEKYVMIGFQAWITWHQLTNTNIQKRKWLYDDFMNSNLYLSFVKFGRHVLDTKMINPEQFIKFVILNSIKLDNWRKDTVYETYVRYICRKEDVESAIERHVLLMEQWASDNDMNWLDFFNKVNTNIALRWIQTGKISPWILLNALTADQLTLRMSDEQILLLDQYIDISWWNRHMARMKKEKKFVENILREYKI